MSRKNISSIEKTLTISINSKEESLLRKKILSLDAMKNQVAKAMTLDQKLIYNRINMKIKRSEISYARIIGNKDAAKYLTNTMLSSFKTTQNEGSEGQVKDIVGHKPLRATTAILRPWKSSRDMELTDKSYAKNSNCENKMYDLLQNEEMGISMFKNKRKNPKANNRFYSAPGPKTFEEKQSQVIQKRPKTSHLLLNTSGTNYEDENPSMTKDTISNFNEEDFQKRILFFIEEVKSLKQKNSSLRDYYSNRLSYTTRRKETSSLRKGDEEDRAWLPVGKEASHRSVTIKNLDRDFCRKEIPMDILFMEQYNLVLTKENYTVRNWLNNDPYLTTKSVQNTN